MPDVAVPTPAPLARVNQVELAHTGRWALGSGMWTAAREDFVAAVAALDCPAVRRPVLKLGHSQGEEPLWAGNPTGMPAVGFVDNMGTANQGHTLVGDFVGMPGWLGDIAASAYPDRSIEGAHNFRCQLGHTHPFVVTAVALLGVTRPGVGTLKSLQDVGRLYGVQAAGEVVAFDPSQPRWPDGAPGGLGGQWRGETPDVGKSPGVAKGGRKLASLPDSVVSTTLKTEAGPDLKVHTDADGMHLEFGTSRSGALDRSGAEKLADLLRREEDDDSGPVTNSAASYTTPGQPTGFVGVTQDGRNFELELLNNEDRVKLTSGEARQLADLANRYGVASRADTDAGPVDLWLDGDRIGLRAPADEGGHVEMSFAPQDWARLRGAVNIVSEGYDELGEVGPEGAEVSALRVDSEHGPLLVSRLSEAPDGTPTLSIAPEDGGWLIQWVDRFDAPFPDAVVWLESAAESLDIHQFSEARRLRGVTVAAAVNVQAHMMGRHNQETHGRRYGPGGNPIRRLTRGGRRNAIGAMNRLLRSLRGDEAANRPGMTGGPLTDVVRSVRDGVDSGQFTPDQALTLLSSLVFRPDVASNPRLSTALAEATGRLREGDRRNVPEMPRVDAPAPPRPPTPEPPRPAPGNNAELVSRLRAGTSADARAALAGLTAAQLRSVADEVGAAYGSGWPKQRLIDSIVQMTVGFRERSTSIMRGGGGPGEQQAVAAAADVLAEADRNQLKHYWTRDPRGLAKWATKPHPWTALYRQLRKHVGSDRAKRIASSFFHAVFGYWPGHRKGTNPVGPG